MPIHPTPVDVCSSCWLDLKQSLPDCLFPTVVVVLSWADMGKNHIPQKSNGKQRPASHSGKHLEKQLEKNLKMAKDPLQQGSFTGDSQDKDAMLNAAINAGEVQVVNQGGVDYFFKSTITCAKVFESQKMTTADRSKQLENNQSYEDAARVQM